MKYSSIILCLGLLCSGVCQTAAAIERLSFRVESMQGADWRAEGLQWQLALGEQDSSQISIQRVQLPAPYGDIRELEIDCQRLVFEAAEISCAQGQLTAEASWLEKKPFPVDFRYRPGSQQLSLRVQGMPAFGGQFSMEAAYAGDWEVEVDARQVAAAQLADWLPALVPMLKGWQFSGPLDAEVQARGPDIRYRFETAGLTLGDTQGRYASEALQAEVSGELHAHKGGWRGETELSIAAGQAYVEPVFADFSEHPAGLVLKFEYGDTGAITLHEAELSQPSVLQASASGHWTGKAWQLLQVKVRGARAGPAYALYAKPFLLGTALESMVAAGEVDVDMQMDGQGLQSMKADLRSVVLEDTQGRFAWDQVNGDIHWNRADDAPVSRLRWAGGTAYKLLFGATELQLRAQAGNLTLMAPLRQPLLEGALMVREFAVRNLGKADMAVQFDGALEPLDLEALTTALGWPRFGGQLAGRLPDLNYESGVLTVGGALQADVFDGQVEVNQLRVQDPFGKRPQLFADMRIHNLDLEAVTSAFSFGRIQGRLEGKVSQLQMLNWQPVAFDAHLITPADDDSRHRISQRAIENISAIGGGGAGAVLSRGFLQFFEDFAYDRIGLSCRLVAGVCQMGGLGPSADGNGYVLVKGRLLPRIDVIGYAQEVDWATLVEQLKTVTAGEGPVVR